MKSELLEKLVMKLMDLDSSELSSASVAPWSLSKKYFIRTVTMHLLGELIFISDKELVMKDASWVADSGRFNEALKTGKLDEVEPFICNIIVNRAAIIDATEWLHDLPREVK